MNEFTFPREHWAKLITIAVLVFTTPFIYRLSFYLLGEQLIARSAPAPVFSKTAFIPVNPEEAPRRYDYAYSIENGMATTEHYFSANGNVTVVEYSNSRWRRSSYYSWLGFFVAGYGVSGFALLNIGLLMRNMRTGIWLTLPWTKLPPMTLREKLFFQYGLTLFLSTIVAGMLGLYY